MTTAAYKNSLVMTSVFVATMVSAQTDEVAAPSGIRLPGNEEILRNRIGLSYRIGLNISVDFKGLGGFQGQGAPLPPLGPLQDRFYDDGFNRVDSSQNKDGLTWFWGYSAESQIQGNAAIAMHRNSSEGSASSNDVDDGVHHGFELTYNRDLGELAKGRWGLEAAFGYMDLVFTDDRMRSGFVTRVTDSYALEGVIPPLVDDMPYAGTFQGPGPVISDQPDRVITEIPQGAMITGKRRLESDFYGFRFGPYWERSLSEKFEFSLSGGLALAVVDSFFKYRETVSITGVGTSHSRGSSSKTDVLLGGFVSGNISYALSSSTQIFVGGQYQYLGTYSQQVNGKKAVVDLGASVFVALGLAYSF